MARKYAGIKRAVDAPTLGVTKSTVNASNLASAEVRSASAKLDTTAKL